MSHWRRGLGALALVLLGVVLLAAPAGAHAVLVATDPAGGAQLTAAPTSVSVTFNEEVQAKDGDLRVYDADGTRVDRGGVERLDGGRTVRVAVRALDDGSYATSWRLVSADSHPVSGGVTWQVGDGPAAGGGLLDRVLSERNGSPTVVALGDVARGLLFASALVLVGGWAFLVLLWPEGERHRGTRRLLLGAAGLLAVSTALGLALHAADVAGKGMAETVSPSALGDVLGTDFGIASVVRFLVAVLVVALTWPGRAVRLRSNAAQTAAAVLAAVLLLTITVSGHARSGRWLAVSPGLDLVHLAAAATWLGGLAVLLVGVLPGEVAAARRLARRFSSVAFWSVVVLVLTGSAQTLRQVHPLGDITRTDFGQLLLVKLAAVAVLVGLAAYSRSVVRAPWEQEDDPDGEEGRRALRQGVGAEAFLAALVLAATSLLVVANPSTASVGRPFSASRTVDKVVVDADVTPGLAGRNTMHLYVTAVGATLTTEVAVTAEAELPSAGVGPIQLDVVPSGRNHWTAEGAQFPAKGTWTLRVKVRVGEFDETIVPFEVPIR
jgi:copper transport protein